MKTKFLTLFLMAFIVSCANAQPPKYENFNSPVSLLSSYYDAVNQKDYRRAYEYWQTPTDSYENFVKGYSDTEKVRLIIEPPNRIEGAAGSLYAAVPTVLLATQKDGKQQIFSGCYTVRKSNLQPSEDNWHIYRAILNPASPEAEIPALLAKACSQNADNQTENQPARIPGALGFDNSQLSEAISAPASAEANKDFQISIITSGNGCVSAGETDVVLSDSSADIFVYDLTSATRPDVVCTMILKQLTHTATLRFTKSGKAIIRVWGRQQSGSPFGKPVVVEKTITVR